MPAYGQQQSRAYDIRTIFSSSANNLHGVWFGKCIAYWNIAENGDGAPGPWYRVLRYRNGFNFVDSVRLGLYLARS